MALLVFLLAFVLDVLWAWYIQWTAAKRRWLAAAASVGTATCGLLSIVAVVDDRAMVLPYLAGIALGTLIGVGKREDE